MYPLNSGIHLSLLLPINRPRPRLMLRKHQRIRDNDILASTDRKHHHLCNITRRERVNPFIDLLCGSLVAAEPHDAELGLDLAGVDFDDADAGVDGFAPEGVGEGADGGFGAAVDGAAWRRERLEGFGDGEGR